MGSSRGRGRARSAEIASWRASSPASPARPSASAAEERTFASASRSAWVKATVPRKSATPASTSTASFRPSSSSASYASIAAGRRVRCRSRSWPRQPRSGGRCSTLSLSRRAEAWEDRLARIDRGRRRRRPLCAPASRRLRARGRGAAPPPGRYGRCAELLHGEPARLGLGVREELGDLPHAGCGHGITDRRGDPDAEPGTLVLPEGERARRRDRGGQSAPDATSASVSSPKRRAYRGRT